MQVTILKPWNTRGVACDPKSWGDAGELVLSVSRPGAVFGAHAYWMRRCVGLASQHIPTKAFFGRIELLRDSPNPDCVGFHSVTQMKNALRAVTVALLVVMLLLGAVGSVRWAKRGGAAARLIASALILGLGMGIVVNPPQQGVEQAEEEQDRTGGDSGEPPAA